MKMNHNLILAALIAPLMSAFVQNPVESSNDNSRQLFKCTRQLVESDNELEAILATSKKLSQEFEEYLKQLHGSNELSEAEITAAMDEFCNRLETWFIDLWAGKIKLTDIDKKLSYEGPMAEFEARARFIMFRKFVEGVQHEILLKGAQEFFDNLRTQSQKK